MCDEKNEREDIIEREIQSIIYNANNSNDENRVSVQLTLAQAATIRDRAIQLKQESKSRPIISHAKKAWQINECWKIRERRIRRLRAPLSRGRINIDD